MGDLRNESGATARPLGRDEIERRLRAGLETLLAGRPVDTPGRPVAISAADLVRLAAPMTSRN